MYIEKGNLLIRNATADDAKTLCNWWNDGKVMAHAGFPNGIGTTEQAVSKSLKTDTEQNRRLILEIDNAPVGEMNYRTVAENVAEIGIKICNLNQQEKGYGTQFLKMLINYLFEHMGYEKIKLDTNLNNIRAQHVYEKVGFQKVSVNVDSWKNQLGELQSSVDYELTKDKYLQFSQNKPINIGTVIIDTYPSFIEYWDRVKSLQIDMQIEAWHSNYMSKWIELMEKQISEYKNDGLDWKVVAKERLFPSMPENLDKLKQARDNLLEVVDHIYGCARKSFAIDFKIVFVIYVGIGLGAGWATTYDRRPACLFGLENIAELGWHDKETLAALTAHELGHLVYFKWRDELGLPRGSGSFWHLFEEGLAMRFEHIIMEKDTWHEHKGQNEWVEWCNKNKSWLAEEFLRRVDNNEPVRDFFGSWYNIQGYAQCGYFLGHEVIKELEQKYTIKGISTFSLDEVERLLRQTLNRMVS